MKRFARKGVASFYIVAFSSLILVIVAASFATYIINEITRTSNDDLSQSAYDAALAGIEDAKLAAISYRRCKMNGAVSAIPNNDGKVTCGEIVYWAENADCYTVGHILGRIGETATPEEGVFIKEEIINNSNKKNKDNNNSNALHQAYTCALFRTDLDDYRTELSSGNPQKVIKVEFSDSNAANNIDAIKISWFSYRDGKSFDYANFDSTNNKVTFKPVNANGSSTPPTIFVQVIQTGPTYRIEDFAKTSSPDNPSNAQSNRGTVFLVPTDKNPASGSTHYVANGNIIPATALAMSNTHDSGTQNLPYVVKCNKNTTDEFACNATIKIPRPYGGGTRNPNTFMISIGMPYEQPDTDISVEFVCKEGSSGSACPNSRKISDGNTRQFAKLSGVQVEIDSTGRANDLFRRITTRMETTDNNNSAFMLDAIQLLDSNYTFTKDMTVTHQ